MPACDAQPLLPLSLPLPQLVLLVYGPCSCFFFSSCHLPVACRDDVIFHDKWAAAMGCERLMHKTEVNRRQKTRSVCDLPSCVACMSCDQTLSSCPCSTLGSSHPLSC